MKRPPIVVVMGSVDHGKTTLLDTIRKTNTASREAGGITQSIGAYEIEYKGEKITFIDTPGHEAFLKMRARGAIIADIGILVVAADDGIKPQTIESIKILRETKTPFIVAINKIDRVENLDKIKNDLLTNGVALEGLGGDISFQPISAKDGTGTEELLDLVKLTAEVEELTFDPKKPFEGIVLESHTSGKRGASVSTIVREGMLRIGDEVYTETAEGKVKMLEDIYGKKIEEALPSAPVIIIGFVNPPKAGEKISAGKRGASETTKQKTALESSTDEKAIRLILKADASGSLEALEEVLKGAEKGDETIRIMRREIGEITDGDVQYAISTKANIVGFRVKATKAADTLARTRGITITSSDIVYDLIKSVEGLFAKARTESFLGILEVLKTFGKKERNQIIGGIVREGAIRNRSTVGVERRNAIVGTAKIMNLQSEKKDAESVASGQECGMLIDAGNVEIKPGDLLKSR